jgi:hypothetical protein
MRLPNRIAVERRLRAAEAEIGKRVLDRAIALLAEEWKCADWTTRRAIEATMSRLAAGEIDGLATTDLVRPLLGDLAASAPDVARRIAAAVGIEIGLTAPRWRTLEGDFSRGRPSQNRRRGDRRAEG